MKTKKYAAQIKEWSQRNGMTLLFYDIGDSVPSEEEVAGVLNCHSELIKLYEDGNGINVVWESPEDEELHGIYRIPTAVELIGNQERMNRLRSEYSDDEIINSGYNKDWWVSHLDIFKSLKMFMSERNGDGICKVKKIIKSTSCFMIGWIG